MKKIKMGGLNLKNAGLRYLAKLNSMVFKLQMKFGV
jgi:hypothetical protein